MSIRRLVIEFVQVARIGFICGPNSGFSKLHKSWARISHPTAVDRLGQSVVNSLADSVHQAIYTEWLRFGNNQTLEMEHVWGNLPLLERWTQMHHCRDIVYDKQSPKIKGDFNIKTNPHLIRSSYQSYQLRPHSHFYYTGTEYLVSHYFVWT